MNFIAQHFQWNGRIERIPGPSVLAVKQIKAVLFHVCVHCLVKLIAKTAPLRLFLLDISLSEFNDLVMMTTFVSNLKVILFEHDKSIASFVNAN